MESAAESDFLGSIVALQSHHRDTSTLGRRNSACFEACRCPGFWGFRVLRFWNHEVLMQSEAVQIKILSALQADDKPHPHLASPDHPPLLPP